VDTSTTVPADSTFHFFTAIRITNGKGSVPSHVRYVTRLMHRKRSQGEQIPVR